MELLAVALVAVALTVFVMAIFMPGEDTDEPTE